MVKMGNWYAKKLGGVHDQALIIDEETGRNVAVVYDKKDAPVLAAAPVMLEALKLAESCLDVAQSVIDDDKTMDNTLTAMIKARAAIEAAEKGE